MARRSKKSGRRPGFQPSSKMKNWGQGPVGSRSAAATPKPGRPSKTEVRAEPLVKLARDLREKARLADLNLMAVVGYGDDGVRIYRTNHTYATVTLDAASLTHGIDFEADFTADGDHWCKLYNLLAEAVAEQVPDLSFPEPVSERIVTELPGYLGDEAYLLAVQATTTIRENFRTYRHCFVLADDEYRVQFWPRTENGGVLALPFAFAPVGDAPVHGRLCIRRKAKILPLAVSSTVSDDRIGTAWVAALCAYAQYMTSAGTNTGDREEMPEHESPLQSQRSGTSARVQPADAVVLIDHDRDGDHGRPADREGGRGAPQRAATLHSR